jgi:hypothetical protein
MNIVRHGATAMAENNLTFGHCGCLLLRTFKEMAKRQCWGGPAGPDDFNGLRAKMAQRWGPVRLGNVIHRIKSVFKYALEAGLISRPLFSSSYSRV